MQVDCHSGEPHAHLVQNRWVMIKHLCQDYQALLVDLCVGNYTFGRAEGYVYLLL